MTKPRVLALVGPTASGKSALAMQLAKALGGEIICMDSMQVYRGMDIGTAKPTKQEQASLPHHLLDVADPGDAFSVADYASLATAVIHDILARGKLPVLCGGTGLYLRALSQPMSLGNAAADQKIRHHYQAMAEQQGNQAVHDILTRKDPQSAARLHPNDLRRVIRALEVQQITGLPFSAQQLPGPEAGPFDIRPYALTWPREVLYQRINLRFDKMMDMGLVDEVQGLLDAGVSPDAQSMQGLGYKELVPYLLGQADIKEVAEAVRQRTRNYAKRQLTWFGADDRVTWLDGHLPPDELVFTIAKEVQS